MYGSPNCSALVLPAPFCQHLPQALHRELMYEGIHVDSISGDQPNSARTAACDNFRAGKTWVLIATDLIGRGERVCLCLCLCLRHTR